MKKKSTKTATQTSTPELPLGTAQADKPAVSSKPKAPVQVQNDTGHRLSVGDVLDMNGKEYVVWFKNDSRAAVAPLSDKIEYRLRDDGRPSFMSESKHVENISPNAESKILRSLGRDGLREFLDKRNAETPKEEEVKTKKAAAKKEKGTSTPGIRAGSLGTFDHPQLKDYSIAAVIRAMAKNGWTFAECRAFCDKEGVKASDQTIKLNIYRGKNGVDGEPAPVKADLLKELKPKVEQKAKKSEAKEKSGKKDKPAKAEKSGKEGKKSKKSKKDGKTPDSSDSSPKKPAAGDKAAAQIKALKEKSKAA